MDAIDDSYTNLLAIANAFTLVDLVSNDIFVSNVSMKTFDETGQEDLALATHLVDLFHDHFNLNSNQRKHVTRSIMGRQFSIRQLFEQYDGQPVSARVPWLDSWAQLEILRCRQRRLKARLSSV